MPDEEKTLTFEESFSRLETVISSLESGRTSLSESLALYEEGVHLVRTCREHIDGAQRKIEIISGTDPDGNPVTKPLEEDERTLEEKSRTRGR